MIPAHIIKKIRRIHIKSSRMVNTVMAGQYRSVFRGSGIEFEEVREYCPGDDIKTLDWKVSARLGKPFVKVYREEREGIVMLLVDMSFSLKFGTFSGTKLEKAAEAASVLAFNAIRNNDRVGVIFFTDRVEKYIPPKKGSAHVWRVIKEIFTFSPGGSRTSIGSALDCLAKISRRRCIAFVLSDFLDDNYLKTLKTVRRRHEIIGILIHDKNESRFPGRAVVDFTDFETGRRITLDGFDRKTRDRFHSCIRSRHDMAVQSFSKAKSDIIELGTQDSVSDVLLEYFRYREKRSS